MDDVELMTIKKNKWILGTPTKSGLYWFNNGLKISKIKSPIFIAKTNVYKNDIYTQIYGYGGEMPLRYVYNEKYCNYAKYKEITIPKKWFKINKFIKTSKLQYLWFKDSKDNIGIGILRSTDSKYLAGTSIWLGNGGSASGDVIDKESNYVFSPVKIPRLRVKNLKL